jgi:hypothetical protein
MTMALMSFMNVVLPFKTAHTKRVWYIYARWQDWCTKEGAAMDGVV